MGAPNSILSSNNAFEQEPGGRGRTVLKGDFVLKVGDVCLNACDMENAIREARGAKPLLIGRAQQPRPLPGLPLETLRKRSYETMSSSSLSAPSFDTLVQRRRIE